MKILIITDAGAPQINGVVRTYENLSVALRERGHDVRILAPRDCPHRLPLPFYPEIECALWPRRTVKNTITTFAPDHIHIATEGPLGWAARGICLRQNRSFTTSFHSLFAEFIAARVPAWLNGLRIPVTKTIYSCLRRFHRPAFKTFVVTPSLAAHLVAQGFTDNFVPLTRGVDTTLFHPAPKTRFGTLHRPVALYAGRLAPEKNIDAFIAAPWTGAKVIVGDGPMRHHLQTANPTITFLGALTGTALAACYQSADLFVFPSKTDTFGMVNIEAMACGLPIVAYPVLGPRDIVTCPELGCLDTDLGFAMKQAISGDGTAEFRHFYAKKMYSWAEAATQFLSGLPNYG